jgi:hypothetical protein
MIHDISHDMRKDSELKAGKHISHRSSEGRQGALAEFKALRQEIERRSKIQHNLFALQLTTAAAIFSFALSGKGRAEFLLIIPISTSMLCSEFVDQINGINKAAIYINDELSQRIHGGLGWELWSHRRGNVQSNRIRIVALMVAFPAIALAALLWAALAWAAPNVFSSQNKLASDLVVAGGVKVTLIIFWIIGLITSVYNIVIIFQTDDRMPYQFIAAEIRSQETIQPTVSSLCKEYKVSKKTSIQALTKLRDDGSINPQQYEASGATTPLPLNKLLMPFRHMRHDRPVTQGSRGVPRQQRDAVSNPPLQTCERSREHVP